MGHGVDVVGERRPGARANDPTASLGHAKRNAPGAADQLFFAYYGQVATMVKEERGEAVPELVRRTAFAAPRKDPPAAMKEVLVRAYTDGVEAGDVLADCGYSNRDLETFASLLRRAGASLVVDLHPEDEGALLLHARADRFCGRRRDAPGHVPGRDEKLPLPAAPSGPSQPRSTATTQR